MTPLIATNSFSSHAGLIIGGSGLVFLVLGTGLVLVAQMMRRRRAEFDARATAVPGEVLDNVWRAANASTVHLNVSLLAYPLLRYRLPDGTVVEQESFEGRSPPAARKGSTVTVVYDPADPRRVRVAKESVLPTIVTIFGAIFAGIGALMAAGALALLVL